MPIKQEDLSGPSLVEDVGDNYQGEFNQLQQAGAALGDAAKTFVAKRAAEDQSKTLNEFEQRQNQLDSSFIYGYLQDNKQDSSLPITERLVSALKKLESGEAQGKYSLDRLIIEKEKVLQDFYNRYPEYREELGKTYNQQKGLGKKAKYAIEALFKEDKGTKGKIDVNLFIQHAQAAGISIFGYDKPEDFVKEAIATLNTKARYSSLQQSGLLAGQSANVVINELRPTLTSDIRVLFNNKLQEQSIKWDGNTWVRQTGGGSNPITRIALAKGELVSIVDEVKNGIRARVIDELAKNIGDKAYSIPPDELEKQLASVFSLIDQFPDVAGPKGFEEAVGTWKKLYDARLEQEFPGLYTLQKFASQSPTLMAYLLNTVEGEKATLANNIKEFGSPLGDTTRRLGSLFDPKGKGGGNDKNPAAVSTKDNKTPVDLTNANDIAATVALNKEFHNTLDGISKEDAMFNIPKLTPIVSELATDFSSFALLLSTREDTRDISSNVLNSYMNLIAHPNFAIIMKNADSYFQDERSLNLFRNSVQQIIEKDIRYNYAWTLQQLAKYNPPVGTREVYSVANKTTLEYLGSLAGTGLSAIGGGTPYNTGATKEDIDKKKLVNTLWLSDLIEVRKDENGNLYFGATTEKRNLDVASFNEAAKPYIEGTLAYLNNAPISRTNSLTFPQQLTILSKALYNSNPGKYMSPLQAGESLINDIVKGTRKERLLTGDTSGQ